MLHSERVLASGDAQISIWTQQTRTSAWNKNLLHMYLSGPILITLGHVWKDQFCDRNSPISVINSATCLERVQRTDAMIKFRV